MAIAPKQLPFAPRPIPTEWFSSWLLRVAAANLVSLRELLAGWEARYGRMLTDAPIDYSLPQAAIVALSRFCRVAPDDMRALDLRQRVPYLNPARLLRFQNADLLCPRYSLHRVRYALCPLWIAEQQEIHVRWDWSIAGLIGCAVHRTPLLDGGPVCREPDPLTLANSQRSPNSLCRSCGTDLSLGTHDSTTVPGESDIHAGEDAYRAALSGVAPGLLGKATDRAFRQFVEDMLPVLTHCLNFHSAGPPPGAMPFSRQDIQQIVAALILNAVPSPDQSKRNKRYARGLHLWATLLKVIPPHRGPAIQQSSLRWPIALRRRFVSALHHRTQKRWPYTPYRAAKDLDRRIERSEIAAVYGLRPPVQGRFKTSPPVTRL